MRRKRRVDKGDVRGGGWIEVIGGWGDGWIEMMCRGGSGWIDYVRRRRWVDRGDVKETWVDRVDVRGR